MIHARRLTVGYGERIALAEISFDFFADKTTAFMGPGGAGKSTLLKTIGGNSYSDKELWITGELFMPKLQPLILMQKPPIGDMTLLEYFRKIFKNPRKELPDHWRCAPDAYKALKKEFKTPLNELPRKIRRLAEFTAVITRNGDYLLLDEPDSETDDEGRSWIISKLKELRAQRTIILTTHNLILGRMVSDYVVLFDRGGIVEAADTEEFFTNPALAPNIGL